MTLNGWIEALINKAEYFGSNKTTLISALNLSSRTTQQRTNSAFAHLWPRRMTLRSEGETADAEHSTPRSD